jgi:hypothetical protein
VPSIQHFLRPGDTPEWEVQIKRPHPTVKLSGVILDRDLPPDAARDCDRSKVETRGAAHAVPRGQLFERIVRHTWRIAAFEKQSELAAIANKLACMGSAFSYDCDH